MKTLYNIHFMKIDLNIFKNNINWKKKFLSYGIKLELYFYTKIKNKYLITNKRVNRIPNKANYHKNKIKAMKIKNSLRSN